MNKEKQQSQTGGVKSPVYNIAVCDDNKEYQSKIREMIWKNPDYNPDLMTVYLFPSGEDFLKSDTTKFQLVFLDMQMGELDGYETAKNIRKRNDITVLAFCSGVVTPLPEHFDVQPYRYFMKQFDAAKIESTISDLLVEMMRRNISKIEIVSDGKALRIPVDQILYMERQKRGSLIYLSEYTKIGQQSYIEVMSNESLEEWYAQLMEEGFEFVHKSFLVNLKQIIAVVKDAVVFPNGEQIRITKTYKNQFMERFSHYFSKKFRRSR